MAILITGCSSGIGHAAAEWLAARGHTVYASARRLDSIADLAAKGCRTLPLDVTDDDSARAAVAAVEEAEGAVGALVNNAGYGQQGAIEAVSIDALRDQFETNLLGCVRMAQLVLPGMRRQGKGRIVNISSLAGLVSTPGGGVYAASKHALEAVSDALRFEVRGFGIQVVLIEPGPVHTEKIGQPAESYPPPEAVGGIYASFHEAIAKADAEGDESFLAGKLDNVCNAIEKAITSRRPRPRYRVTPLGRAVPPVRRVLPDRAWDAFMRSQTPRPPS